MTANEKVATPEEKNEQTIINSQKLIKVKTIISIIGLFIIN